MTTQFYSFNGHFPGKLGGPVISYNLNQKNWPSHKGFCSTNFL